MSIAELERFAAALKSSEALRGEAEKAAANTSHAMAADFAVAFAASKGYAFTANEAKEYLRAKLLSDAELAGVAGGTATNAEYGAMLETLRANRGNDEDKSKAIASQLQAMKDLGQKTSDFLSSYIDLLKSINSKITR